MNKHKTHILQLDKDDPKKEMEFEIRFQLSLTKKQRYKRMMKLFKQAKDMRTKYDHPKAPAIISRP